MCSNARTGGVFSHGHAALGQQCSQPDYMCAMWWHRQHVFLQECLQHTVSLFWAAQLLWTCRPSAWSEPQVVATLSVFVFHEASLVPLLPRSPVDDVASQPGGYAGLLGFEAKKWALWMPVGACASKSYIYSQEIGFLADILAGVFCCCCCCLDK